MNISTPQNQLIKIIKENGKFMVESRQISTRLKNLLDEHLGLLSQSTSKYKKKGMLRLENYTEAPYKETVDRYLEIRGKYLEAKINYETHQMLYFARQTIRKIRGNSKINLR